jgi:hypothetical protein
MTTYQMDKDVMDELLNDAQAKSIVMFAREAGSDEMMLRSYYLPDYQRRMVEALAELHDMSKAAVIRQIIDEWYSLRLTGR